MHKLFLLFTEKIQICKFVKKIKRINLDSVSSYKKNVDFKNFEIIKKGTRKLTKQCRTFLKKIKISHNIADRRKYKPVGQKVCSVYRVALNILYDGIKKIY